MAYWGRAISHTKQIEEAISPGDGVNTFNTPFEIKPSEAVSSLNTSNRQYPALTVRPGSEAMFGTAASPLTTPYGSGSYNSTFPVFAHGTVLRIWVSTTFFQIASGLTGAKTKILEFNTQDTKHIVFTNGTDKKYWTGSVLGDITDGPATKLYAVDDFRLYALKNRTIYNSAAGSITDWTTVDDAGENVCVGMKGTETALVTYNDSVIAFSDQTMHVLNSNSPLDNLPLSDPIPVGCVSDRSTAIVNGMLYFLDYGKYKAYSGGYPFDVSRNVKGYLENINYAYMENICAGIWGKYIYLSIPYGATQTTNNITLEYDTELGKWYPWNMGFESFYNLGEDLFGVTVGGVVKKLNTGTADDTTAIAWEFTTGAKMGTPVRSKKVISDIWAIIDLPIGSTFTVSYSTAVDSGSFTLLKTYTPDALEQSTRLQIPTSILQNIPWYRLKLAGAGPCTIHYLEIYSRIKKR